MKIGLMNNPSASVYDEIASFGKAQFDFVWTDINRQRPYNSAVNNWVDPRPGQSDRWGANHLYEADGWPTGSHVANRDGSVTWTPGDELEPHVLSVGSTMWFW